MTSTPKTMLPLTVVLVVAVVILAGCVGSIGGDEGPGSTGDGPANGSPDASETDGREAAGDETGSANGTVDVLNVDWDGHVPTTACVPVSTGSCAPKQVTDGDRRRRLPHATPPRDTNVSLDGELVLHWNATTPWMEELRVSVRAEYPCNSDACDWGWTGINNTWGTSPLVIDLTGLTLPTVSGRDRWVGVEVSAPYLSSPYVFGQVEHDQDFHLTGQLRLRIPGDRTSP